MSAVHILNRAVVCHGFYINGNSKINLNVLFMENNHLSGYVTYRNVYKSFTIDHSYIHLQCLKVNMVNVDRNLHIIRDT